MGLIVFLLIVGLCLVMAEAFFPSMGILSVLAALSICGSVFLAFQEGTGLGVTFLVLALTLAPLTFALALRWLPNTAVGRSLLLSAPESAEVSRAAEAPGLHDLEGCRGISLSVLRPAGFARIEGRRVDVVTRGEMIDRDAPVRVLQVEGNRVVVGRDADLPNDSPADSPTAAPGGI